MARPPIIVSPDNTIPRRELVLVALLVLLTWIIQLRYPPLSYPHVGLLELTVLALLAVMLPVRLFRSRHGAPVPRLHPAFMPGFLFVLWALGRWAFGGFQFSGTSDIGTMLWCGGYVLVAYCMTRSAETADPGSPRIPVGRMVLASVSAVGLVCGIHAAWQYFFSYEQAYQQLLAQIGNRPPDQTEAGLLHHLQLRRVASIFGDPNTLATFSAIALCASLELLTAAGSGGNRLLRGLGGAAIPAIFLAIFYSGSRGGVLDALLVLTLFGGYLLYTRRPGSPAMPGVVAIFLVALLVAGQSVASLAQTEAQTAQSETRIADDIEAKAGSKGWIWRSNTITERIHYLTVGARMVQLAPIAGLGPGSVERYFGRLKPPEARETKFLHNWVVQISAELGLVGLGLALWFIIAIAREVIRARLWKRAVDRAFLAIFVLVIFDALIQVTWNQRELMSTFGLITGLIMGRTVPPNNKERNVAPVTLRLAVCVVFVTIFAILEGRFLAGKSAKYRALDAMATGDAASARREWESASLWTAQDPEPYAARASMAIASGHYSSARQLLDKALTLNPDSASMSAQMAAVAEDLGQEDEAYRYLTKALELYPSHPEYNYLMAQHLYEHGKRTQALKYARQAVKNNYMEENAARYQALVYDIEREL